MPRGKRKTCLEKLGEVQGMIQALEGQLKELKVQERELLKAQRDEELKQIADIMEENNLTAEDLVSILSDLTESEAS